MKKKIVLFLILFVLLILHLTYMNNISSSEAKTESSIMLKGNWKIIFDDNEDYSKLDFDDSNWENDNFLYKNVVKSPEKQNKPLWVRKKFTMPVSMNKDLSNKHKDLMIYIYNLTNGHEIYFNGRLIGKTKISPNNLYNEWNLKHCYIIPDDLINYGGENLVAVNSYSTYEYGAYSEIIIAPFDKILNKYTISTLFTHDLYFAFSSVTLIIGIYLLTMFFVGKAKKKFLYFGILNIIASVYYTNFFIPYLSISLLLFQKIIFFSLHVMVALFLPFLKEYLELDFLKIEKIIFAAFISISFIGLSMCNNSVELYKFRTFYFNFCAAFLFYYLVIGLKSFLFHDKSIAKFGIGLLIASMFFIHDTIYQLIGRLPKIGFQLNGFASIVLLVPIFFELMKEYNYLYINSSTDGLTGLKNYFYFRNTLLDIMNKNDNIVYSIIMIDIDNFKIFNDTFGHITGDIVLKNVGKILMNNIKNVSISARYGGEEFVILLKNAPVKTSMEIAESIRKSIATMECKNINASNEKSRDVILKITASFGIATGYLKQELSIEGFIDKADKALYYSKRNGKNKIMHFNDLEALDIS